MTPFDKPVLFLATADAEHSRAFYERVLGMSCVADEPYALVFRVGDLMLRVQKVDRVPRVRSLLVRCTWRAVTFVPDRRKFLTSPSWLADGVNTLYDPTSSNRRGTRLFSLPPSDSIQRLFMSLGLPVAADEIVHLALLSLAFCIPARAKSDLRRLAPNHPGYFHRQS